MHTFHNNLQRNYFEKNKHRFPIVKILKPRPQHQLEFSHILKQLQLQPPQNILDFGSGSGRISIPLLALGFDIWAVDLSRKSLRDLQKIYKSMKTKSWGKLHVSTSIPESITFDAIVGADILHHVNIKEYVFKLKKVLKKGGILVFSEPNAWYLPWYLFFLLFHSWDIEKGILQCSLNNLRKLFDEAGFHNISIEGHGLLPTPIFNRIPTLASFNALFLGNLSIMKYFAFRFIISAKK